MKGLSKFAERWTKPVLRAAGALATAVLVLSLAGPSPMAQGTAPMEKKIKTVPCEPSRPESGAVMFKDYCAVCHGATGKGDGPAVDYLKGVPPDLTTMKQRGVRDVNLRVQAVLTFGTESKAHGITEMPLWGDAFRHRDNNQQIARLRIHNLSNYVAQMQKK